MIHIAKNLGISQGFFRLSLNIMNYAPKRSLIRADLPERSRK